MFTSSRSRFVRRITPNNAADARRIYLTFDDGPEKASTLPILDELAKQNTVATFFVVAEKAQQNRQIIRQIVEAGHAIGNHSLDHRYYAFFQGQKKLMQWIIDSENKIRDLLGTETVGFRPPAGIVTPEVIRASCYLKMPVILWNVRFFDATFCWNAKRALKSVSKITSGSIVLLHDAQKPNCLPTFTSTLSSYICSIRQTGYEFDKLTLELCTQVAFDRTTYDSQPG